MTIDKLKRILRANGWKESTNVPNGWYRGLATIFFTTDKQGDYIIELPDDDWGYVMYISEVKSTSNRLKIIWKSSEEWKLLY